MRIPESLSTLVDDGIIQKVLRPLMSGKEAQIYLVLVDGELCVAKIYKDAAIRSFKHRADYTEGRKVRNSRDQRAIAKRSKYGKSKDEDAWRATEVDMLRKLDDAGIPVPRVHTFIDGVAIMELVKDPDGNPAPRLGDMDFSPEEAAEIYYHLVYEVQRMLCAGVVHGDLSEFNVLWGAEGPVIIDLPQAADPGKNQNARMLLLRDVENLHRFFMRMVPGAKRRPYGEEMWALYESNRLTPESELTGEYKNTRKADTSAVLELINDANRDELRRRQARGIDERPSELQGDGSGEGEPARPPMRRREVVIEKPAKQTRGRRNAGSGGSPNRGGGAGGGRHGGGGRSGAGGRSAAGGRNAAGGRGRDDGRSGRGEDRSFSRKGPPKRAKKTNTASTYVSPEAKKKGAVLRLTPKNEEEEKTSASPTRNRRRRPSRNSGGNQQRSSDSRPGSSSDTGKRRTDRGRSNSGSSRRGSSSGGRGQRRAGRG